MLNLRRKLQPTVGVCFETSGDAFRDDVGSNVEVLQSRVASVDVHDESVLFHDSLKQIFFTSAS